MADKAMANRKRKKKTTNNNLQNHKQKTRY